MAEAGVVPEEFTLQKALDAEREALSAIADPMERRAAMAPIADLETRTNIAR